MATESKKQKAKRIRRVTPKPLIDSGWFKEKLGDEFGIGYQRAVAKRMHKGKGMHPSVFNRLLKGSRLMTMAEAVEIAEMLRRPLTDIMRRAGITDTPAEHGSAVISGTVDNQGAVSAKPQRGVPKTPLPGGLRDVETLLVNAPRSFTHGWVLYFHSGDKQVAAAKGHLSVIKLAKSDEWLVGVLRHGYADSYTVTPLDGGAVRDQVPVEAAYPVLWIKTR